MIESHSIKCNPGSTGNAPLGWDTYRCQRPPAASTTAWLDLRLDPNPRHARRGRHRERDLLPAHLLLFLRLGEAPWATNPRG